MEYQEGTSEVRELGSKALRSGSFFISSKIISAVVTLLLLVFLARYLKPVDYGIYTIVIALYTLLGMGGNFGMGTALRKKLSEKIKKEKQDYSYSFGTSSSLCSASSSFTFSTCALPSL